MNKILHIRPVLALALMLIAALGLNGNIVSAMTHQTTIMRPASSGDQRPALVFPQAIRDQISLSGSTAPTPYSGYTRVTDNEEAISMDVPVEWNDIETGKWTYKGKEVGVFVAASGDLANFYSTRSQPGVFIGVSQSLARAYNKDGLLDLEKGGFSRQCVYNGRFDYQNLFYTGRYDHYTNCAAGTPNLLVFTTTSADRKFLILLRIVVVSNADLDAAATIFDTFQVLGDPEHDFHHDH